jgi:hypothetical protein
MMVKIVEGNATRQFALIGTMAFVLVGPLSVTHAQPVPPDVFRGSTVETAIALPGIADEFHGAAAEHAYIAAHFPDWHIEYQAQIEHNDRDYDVIGMVKPDRTKATLYFDITDWFGK